MIKKSDLASIAGAYFKLLAENFPVMCSHDEFYFFPRAEESIKYPDRLDNLDKENVEEVTFKAKKILNSLEEMEPSDCLEEEIDGQVLKNSIRTFLRDYDTVRIWQKSPDLYLKIVLFGLSFPRRKDTADFILARLKAVPRILRQAKDNLIETTPVQLEVSLEAVETTREYLKNILDGYGNIQDSFKKASAAIDEFKDTLKGLQLKTGFAGSRELLKSVLKDTYGYDKEPEEVFEKGKSEYRSLLKENEELARQIDSRKDWRELVREYKPGFDSPESLLKAYRDEVHCLKEFIEDMDIISMPESQEVQVRQTPSHLIPLRSSASYCAPMNPEDEAVFYVRLFQEGREKEYQNEVHKEYLFVSAHETYPGHHLLDGRRKGLSFIRRQIESPLFYEGWASYAEQLIVELGYCREPVKRLIGKKRQLWRAVRAVLDVGLHAGKLSPEEAAGELAALGYSPDVSRIQARHYMLTPGYQLTYLVGKDEIIRLREKYASRFGLKEFHDFILNSGEIPFALLDKKMAKEII